MRIEGVHRAKGRHIVGEIPQNSSGKIGKKLPNSPDGFATRLRYDSGLGAQPARRQSRDARDADRAERALPRPGRSASRASRGATSPPPDARSEEHTSELQ